MKIGIDIDGVITDLVYWYKAYKLTVADLRGKEVPDSELMQYFFKDNMTQNTLDNLLWNVTEDEYLQCLSCNLYKFYTCHKPRLGFAELTMELHNQGHELYIITARTEGRCESKYVAAKCKTTFEKFTRSYLEDNGIVFDKLCFSAEDKAAVVEREQIDIMIDDFMFNLRGISEKVPNCRLVYFRHDYNTMDDNGVPNNIEPVCSVAELETLLLKGI